MKVFMVFGIDEKKYSPTHGEYIKQLVASKARGKGVISAEEARKRWEEELARTDIPEEVKQRHLQAISELNACALIYDDIWVEEE